MRYLFSQTENETTTLLVIVKDPEIKDGIVYAKKIGNFIGFDYNGNYNFRACKPAKFIAGGGPWHLEEFTGTLEMPDDTE